MMTEDQAIQAADDLLQEGALDRHTLDVIQELVIRLDTHRTYGYDFAALAEAIQDVERGIRDWPEVRAMAVPVALVP